MQQIESSSSSLLVLANHHSDFQTLQKLLSLYFPSNQHGRIHLDTKYYQAEVDIIRQQWPDASAIALSESPAETPSISSSSDKQDLLIMLVNHQESFPAQLYDFIINKYNPENFILIVNTKDKTLPWGDEEKIANEVNNFIEIIKEDLDNIIQNPPQRTKKGLLTDSYEDGNIFNLLELIETTPWSHITRKHFEKMDKDTKVEQHTNQENQPEKQQENAEEMMGKAGMEEEMNDEQLESEMLAFQSLMNQMQNLRATASQSQKISDDDRKRRAEELMKKLVGGWM